jgi:hypothetical protein
MTVSRIRKASIAPCLPVVIGLLLLVPAAQASIAQASPSIAQASPSRVATAQASTAPTVGTARPVCAAPTPGRASCLAMRLTTTPEKSSPLRTSLTPEELHSAYAFPTTASEPQTIAIVDAYDDPHAEADLGVYDSQFGLPPCTQANGCFTKVNQEGQSALASLPATNGEWSVEISTDIEMAHAICQNCHILLVEAETETFPDLGAAEDTAAALIQTASKPGALEGEISNSWGGEVLGGDSAAFEHPGIVITASAGDSGYLNWDESDLTEEEGYFEGTDYPASSPHVVAVGGTSLTLGRHGEWAGEAVWNNHEGSGGGGCAAFAAPEWQPLAAGWSTVGCGTHRAVADIAADANPSTGVAVYDSVPEPEGKAAEPAPEWTQIGGTSVASPIIASAFALAGGAHGVPYPAATLYAHAGSTALHDITVGGNGKCDDVYSGSCSGSLISPLDCGASSTICNAASGYDGPTGVGTPIGLAAFQPVSGEVGGSGSGSGGNGNGNGGNGNGSGAGGQEGGSSPGGGGSSTPGSGGGTASPGQTGAAPGSSSPNSSKSASGGPARVSHLSLTLNALAALNRKHPRASALAFTFTLSAAAKVQVTLARWTRVRGHWRWVTLPGPFTINAGSGANHGRLGTQRRLTSGRYRLTLAPAHGIAGSIAVVIG